jgi:hypothetical protein
MFCQFGILQCLVQLGPEQTEVLIATVKKSLDATERGLLDPVDRQNIQDDFELDDLQIAAAIAWAPREFAHRKIAAADVTSESTIDSVIKLTGEAKSVEDEFK